MATNLSSTNGHNIDSPYPSRAGRLDYNISGNIISGIDFKGRLNYLVLMDEVELWKIYPNLDDGSQEFYIQELKACTRFEVKKIKRKLDILVSDFHRKGIQVHFLNDIHNECVSILRRTNH